MSRRSSIGFLLGCAAVVVLYVPRCLDALRGVTPQEPASAAMAALDHAPEVSPRASPSP